MNSKIKCLALSTFALSTHAGLAQADAWYDPATAQVFFDSVQVGEVYYSAVLDAIDLPNRVFRVNQSLLLPIEAPDGPPDATYDPSGPRVTVPAVLVGTRLYYASLNLIKSNPLEFQLDLQKFEDITPPGDLPPGVNESQSQIWGTWVLPEYSPEDMYVTFHEDGSYTHFEDYQGEDCTAGYEYGTYVWSLATGLLEATVISDENGGCGLSHPADGVPLRVFIENDVATMHEKGDIEFNILKVSD